MKGIIVIGAAGSGTRITTQILVENGCFGEYDHTQDLDKMETDISKEKFVVIRRSIPHGNWADKRSHDLETLVAYYEKQGVSEIIYVLTHRFPKYMAHSQLSHDGLIRDIAEGFENVELAVRTLNSVLEGKIVPMSYEMLIAYPKIMQKYLCDSVGLKIKKYCEIIDGNKKYE